MSELADILIEATGLRGAKADALRKALARLEGASNDVSTTVRRAGYIASGNTVIEPGSGVTLYNPTTGKPSINLQEDGDTFIGSDITDPASTSLTVFSNDQDYNGEAVEAGDVILGDNSPGRANLQWDKADGKLKFRGGTTANVEVGVDGSLLFAGGKGKLNNEGVVFAALDSGISQFISWRNSNDVVIAYIYHYQNTTLNQHYLTIGADNGTVGIIHLSAKEKVIVTGDLYTDPWTDYSASSTVVGWSSFTGKEIYYKKVGKLVFVSFNLSGTSNSALATFTLPYAPAVPGFRNACQVGDNGSLLAASGFVRTSPADGAKAVVGKDWTSQGNFTASGTKTVQGTFWYEAA